MTTKPKLCNCLRCGHVWATRGDTRIPRICPKCKSAYWNIPRKRQRTGRDGN